MNATTACFDAEYAPRCGLGSHPASERDDVAPTPVEHPGQNRLHHVTRPEEVDGDRAVDLVDRLLGERRRQADAGRVHEPLDRAQRRLDLFHDAFDGVRVGDVAGPGAHGRRACDGGGQAVVVDVDGGN